MVNTMKNIFKIATLVVALARTSALATGVTVVGGEDMFPSKDIIDNAVKSKETQTVLTKSPTGTAVIEGKPMRWAEA